MADTNYQNFRAGFFNSVNRDRLYDADDMNMPYVEMLTEGIFPNGASVEPGTGMKVVLNEGKALLSGRWIGIGMNTMDVPENSTLYSRIDSVIIRIDNNISVRNGAIIYRTGTPSSTPEAPDLINDGTISELRVANVTVAAGATSIAAGNITDNRGESDCPYVHLNVGADQLEETLMDLITDHPELITAVPDGGISTAKLADESVTLAKLASGVIDNTLTQAGAAADAKVTGDALTDLNNDLQQLSNNVDKYGFSVVDGKLCVTYETA